jgi:hypothetical protein
VSGERDQDIGSIFWILSKVRSGGYKLRKQIGFKKNVGQEIGQEIKGGSHWKWLSQTRVPMSWGTNR